MVGILHILFIIGLIMSIIDPYNQYLAPKPQTQDEDVKILVNDFKNLMSGVIEKEVVDNVEITMANLKPPIAGLCWLERKNKLIYLDIKTWKGYSKLQKEVLLFHELGHCVCDLDHEHFHGVYPEDPVVPKNEIEKIKAGFLEDGCPVSIMHPRVLSNSCYKKHRTFYRYELNVRCYARKN